MDKDKIGLLLIAITVIVAGCMDTNGDAEFTQTQGVEITNFTSTPSTVFDTQNANLRMSLTNTGEVDAENVQAEIFNVPFGDNEEQEWEGDQLINFDTLRPADVEAGIPATPRERTITLSPPNLDSGVTIPYDFMARVSFDYSTTGVTEIQLMGEQRFQDTSEARTQPSMDNSAGPIQMEIQTRTPIVYYGGGSTSSDLCVVIRNEGDGTPYLGEQSNTDVVEISASTPGEVDLTPIDSPDEEFIEVDLIGNRGVECFDVSTSSFESTDIQRTLPITIKADYGYYKEGQTSVTVNGRS